MPSSKPTTRRATPKKKEGTALSPTAIQLKEAAERILHRDGTFKEMVDTLLGIARGETVEEGYSMKDGTVVEKHTPAQARVAAVKVLKELLLDKVLPDTRDTGAPVTEHSVSKAIKEVNARKRAERMQQALEHARKKGVKVDRERKIINFKE